MHFSNLSENSPSTVKVRDKYILYSYLHTMLSEFRFFKIDKNDLNLSEFNPFLSSNMVTKYTINIFYFVLKT